MSKANLPSSVVNVNLPVNNQGMLWNGTAWVSASLLQSTNNLSDVNNSGSSRANLHVPALTPAAAVSIANVGSLSGLQTLDGYSLVVGDLVLLTAQTTASQNGLWTAVSGAWTRPTEFASGLTIKGRSCRVINGNIYSGTDWTLTAPTAGIIIDTANQTWESVSYSPLKQTSTHTAGVVINDANLTETPLVINDVAPGRGNSIQLFEIYDHLGNPIFSIPPAGGPAVYGDALRAGTETSGPFIALDGVNNALRWDISQATGGEARMYAGWGNPSSTLAGPGIYYDMSGTTLISWFRANGGSWVNGASSNVTAAAPLTYNSSSNTLGAALPVSFNHLDLVGHSYARGHFGVRNYQWSTARRLMGALGLSEAQMNNIGVDGAELMGDGLTQGGWPWVLNRISPNFVNAPYLAQGGLGVVMYGINDVGKLGDSPQLEAAYHQMLRAVISRMRSAGVFEDTNSSCSYGGTWTAYTGAAGYASGGTTHYTTSVGATVTIAVPSDFPGGTIALGFSGAAGAYGGQASIAIDGTASTTVITSSLMPSGGNHGHACTRLTGLASGGHTILITTTEIDSSGQFAFDYWQIEASDPRPVVVCNIARLPNYSSGSGLGYYSSSWVGSPAISDTTVANYNGVTSAVIAEFTGQIVLADIDSALNKNAALFFGLDGIHPNEEGVRTLVETVMSAVWTLKPTVGEQLTDNTNADETPGIKANYGLAYAPRGSLGTGVINTLSEARSTPIFVPQPTVFSSIGCEITGAASSGAYVRLAIHNDDGSGAYPYQLVYDAGQLAASTASASGTGTLLSINSGSGILLQRGWYWLSATVQDTGTPATYPTMRVFTSSFSNVGLVSTAAAGTAAFGSELCYAMEGITGAWSAVAYYGNWTGTPANQILPPRVFLVAQ
jgi:hypothetical protein